MTTNNRVDYALAARLSANVFLSPNAAPEHIAAISTYGYFVTHEIPLPAGVYGAYIGAVNAINDELLCMELMTLTDDERDEFERAFASALWSIARRGGR